MGRNVVIGQKVDKEKIQRAKEFRRRMTAEEKILWRHLRTNRLQGLHFRRQQVFDGFIVDFYCHQSGLVVEVDGAVHQANAAVSGISLSSNTAGNSEAGLFSSRSR